MKKKYVILSALLLLVTIHTNISKANDIYPLTVFTNNGAYSNNSGLDMYVEVIPMGAMVDFKFHNASSMESSIARIYFDDNSMLSFEGISNGPGTSFDIYSTPHSLPAGQELAPPFETDFSVDADAPGPHNGINPNEMLTIRYNLINSATFGNVTDALNSSDLRIGIHVIALPDGSSEAAITPEPTTILLLSLGAVLLRKKRCLVPK